MTVTGYDLRDGYLAMLRGERGASAHTLRAYERELAQIRRST